MDNINLRLKARGMQQQIHLWKTTERDALVIVMNQFAGHV